MFFPESGWQHTQGCTQGRFAETGARLGEPGGSSMTPETLLALNCTAFPENTRQARNHPCLRLLGMAPSVPQETSRGVGGGTSTCGDSPTAPWMQVGLTLATGCGGGPTGSSDSRRHPIPPVRPSQPRLNSLPLQPSLSHGARAPLQRPAASCRFCGSHKASATCGARAGPPAFYSGDQVASPPRPVSATRSRRAADATYTVTDPCDPFG